jgi:SagB-type dehydrogenase family enzyme
VKVKIAECAALFWDGGKLVWDDYLGRRQFAITADTERVLRFFRDWRGLDSVETDDAALAQHLLDAGLLIAEGSAEHREEQRVLDRWREWGPAARHYHFSARTPVGTRFWDLDEDRGLMLDRAGRAAPPEPFKTYPDRPFVPIDDTMPDSAGWPRERIVDAMFERRSARKFSADALTLAELGTVLHAGGGIVDLIDDPVTGPSVFKTSPSAGARDPIELYVHVSNVDGLASGLHHFSPRRSGLEQLGPPIPREQLEPALGGQPWLVDAPALLIYTAVLERTRWRYPTKRAYRDVLLGLGHVSQTVLLTASAMGLGAITATAVCDESLEALLGCDSAEEPVLAVTALGRAAP